MFAIEIFEGKDQPRDKGKSKYKSKYGKTGGLLLRLLKSYFTTGESQLQLFPFAF